MPTLPDQGLILLITLGMPSHALFVWQRRLLAAGPGSRARVRLETYRTGILLPWALTALAILLWNGQGRAWSLLGMGFSPGLGFWTAVALAGAAIAYASWQRLALGEEEDAKQEILRHLGSVEPLLPRTRTELRWFTAVAVTAGICEELLYRGYLTWYLERLVGLPAAIVLGAALFGMAHAYQGTRGILQTGLVGLGLGIVYVLSGSLWIPMLLHGFIDINSGVLAYSVLRRPDAVPGPSENFPAWPPENPRDRDR